MKPSIQMITIPVVNLLESESFYRSMFELPEEQISAGDEHIAFFLEGDLSFVLFERLAFAATTGQESGDLRSSTLVLTHIAKSKEEVNRILRQAQLAGGSIVQEGVADDWGYSGYFKDPNGHVWEVRSWNSEQ